MAQNSRFIELSARGLDASLEDNAFRERPLCFSLTLLRTALLYENLSQWGVFVSRIAGVTIAVVAFSTPVMAESCNPAIDGTYCASQPNSRLDRSVTRSNPNFGGDFLSMTRANDPATLGAITFQSNGSRCMGLLRRSSCN
jgi:hypothetical protein